MADRRYYSFNVIFTYPEFSALPIHVHLSMPLFGCINLFIWRKAYCLGGQAWCVRASITPIPTEWYVFKARPNIEWETLVRLPASLEFRCENCSLHQFTMKFVEALEDDNNFWNVYLKSLPLSCQNPLCAEPNKSILTVLGYKSVKRVLPQPISNESSVIASRQWKTGLLPVMDLFNHNSKFGDELRLSEDGKEYLLVASKEYKQYEQVYMHYGRQKNTFEMYNRYGFLLDDEFLTCKDIKNDANRRCK